MSRSTAARILLLAVAGGVMTDIVGPGNAPGVNVVILVAGFVAATHAVAGRGGLRRLDRADAWLAPAAVVIAGMAAVRADPWLVGLDVMAAGGLALASVAALGGARITRGLVPDILVAMAAGVGAVCIGAGEVIAAARPARRAATPHAPDPDSGATTSRRRRLRRLAPVGRGLALAVPLVVVFAALFSAADPVFARLAGTLLDWRIDVDFSDLASRAAVVTIVAWVSAGLIALAAQAVPYLTAAHRYAAPDTAAPGAPATGAVEGAGRRLGAVEATTVLGLLDLLFAAFVGLQVAYLFGGRDTLAASGMTYAEYARRGFAELVGVAALAGTVVIGLDLAVGRRSRGQLAASIALLALTGVVLASALLRLRLYQDAYGWTELRFVVLVSIGWLAAAAASTAGMLVLRRTSWAPNLLACLALVALAGMNAVGPQAFVAERNLARAVDPSLVPDGGRTGLDSDYLASLGDEAVPSAVAALDRLAPADRAAVSAFLDARDRRLSTEPAVAGWPSWSLGRERARAALATRSAQGTAR